MEDLTNKLVMLRLPNRTNYSGRQPHYNTWIRVLYHEDNIFIGKVERIDVMDFRLHKIGDIVKYTIDKIQHIYVDGETFCYSDNITICECPALCRNK